MDNIFHHPEFSIRSTEPVYPWLSEQLQESLSQHLNSLQDSFEQAPLFSDLIQDNPGYDLIPSGPLSFIVDPCATETTGEATVVSNLGDSKIPYNVIILA